MKSLIGGVLDGVRSLRTPQIRDAAPVPYASRFSQFTIANAAGGDREAQLRAMGSVGTLFVIVSRLADSTAEVVWHLWRTAPSGKKEDRTRVERHAALDLLTTPNPWYRRRTFIEATQQHIDLTGEGWWVIVRAAAARSIPLELWPVRPDRMEPVPDREKFISGYIYHGPDGEQVPLQVDDVIQIKMPNPVDPYRGMGPVQALMTDLDSARFGAEWNRNFFVNGAEPGGIVEVPENLTDEEFATITSRWREQHQGVANAHRVAVLERGKWVERKFSMRDMQFTQLREVTEEMIRKAYGFPKGMLGSVDDVNRANAEAGEVMFARWLVMPRCERLKDVLNHQLLPLFGPAARGLEFDYETPVPQSREDADRERDSKTQAWATLVTAGADPDDVSEVVGLPRMRTTEPGPPPPPAN